MNRIFVKKYLPFQVEDSQKSVLFFVFALLPLTSLLPHAHLFCALWVVLFLGYGASREGVLTAVEQEKPCRLYTALLFLCLSGVVNFTATAATLLSVVLRLSFFIPFLFKERSDTICRVLTVVGGVVGALTLAALFVGHGTTEYNDASLFPALSRAAGLFGNPNVTAAFLLPPSLLALSELLFRRERRYTSILAFLGCTLAVAATFSRGAWLALAFASLCLLVRRFGLFRVGATTVALLPLLLLLMPSALALRLSSILSPDSSVLYRFSLWKSVARLPASSLIFGVGEGRRAMMEALSPVLASGLLHVEHTHSLFLHLLLSEGAVGLILFLFISMRALIFGKNLGARCAFLSLLLFGIFDDPLYSGQTEVLFWLTLGLC